MNERVRDGAFFQDTFVGTFVFILHLQPFPLTLDVSTSKVLTRHLGELHRGVGPRGQSLWPVAVSPSQPSPRCPAQALTCGCVQERLTTGPQLVVASEPRSLGARPPLQTCAYLGKASKQYVFLVSGNATRRPDIRGEWRMTAAHSYLEARSTVGTVPMLWPYRMMFSGLTPYLEGSQRVHAVS